MNRLRRFLLIFCLVLVLLAVFVLPVWLHFAVVPVFFNQFAFYDLAFDYGAMDADLRADFISSVYASGKNVLFYSQESEITDFSNYTRVLDYVYSWLPQKIIVYPTEGFYYYSFDSAVGEVAGNLRLADLSTGVISMAYFTLEQNQTYSVIRDISNLVHIERINDVEYVLTYNDKTVHVTLPFERALEQPVDLELLDEELFVGRIYDESGMQFSLLFNNITNSFYEILVEDERVTDTFIDVERGFILGERTAFMFYEDKDLDRKLLVGVYLRNVERNNFLDGPADQVPINIPMKELLHRAYPQTLLDAGIDDAGVYQGRDEWVRIAVSPFERYTAPSQVVERLDRCAEYTSEKGLLYTCLTKEWWNTDAWRNGTIARVEAQGTEYLWD